MRRSFTLIELVTAFALGAGLLALLLGTLWQSRLISQRGEEAAAPYRRLYACAQRLEQILPEITPDELYVDGDGLVFTYNNGIDDEAAFSSTVLARLFLDHDRLILATWPLDKDKKGRRTEILMDPIQSIAFSFYQPPYEPEPGWQNTWNRSELPALVKITIDDHPLAYPLVNVDKPIRYFKLD